MARSLSSSLILLLLMLLPLVMAAGRGNGIKEETDSQRKQQDWSWKEGAVGLMDTGAASNSGKGRKLLIETKKSQKIKVVDVPVVDAHHTPEAELDPGVMNIEVMDYSPAKRKPPIHN